MAAVPGTSPFVCKVVLCVDRLSVRDEWSKVNALQLTVENGSNGSFDSCSFRAVESNSNSLIWTNVLNSAHTFDAVTSRNSWHQVCGSLQHPSSPESGNLVNSCKLSCWCSLYSWLEVFFSDPFHFCTPRSQFECGCVCVRALLGVHLLQLSAFIVLLEAAVCQQSALVWGVICGYPSSASLCFSCSEQLTKPGEWPVSKALQEGSCVWWSAGDSETPICLTAALTRWCGGDLTPPTQLSYTERLETLKKNWWRWVNLESEIHSFVVACRWWIIHASYSVVIHIQSC